VQTAFALLLSDGTFKNKNVWYGEKDGMLAFYNGKKEIDNSPERLINGDFEDVSGGMAKGWENIKQDDGKITAPDIMTVKSGNYSMRQDSSTGYVMQTITDLVEGGSYTFSAYVLPADVTTKPAVKIEFHTENKSTIELSHTLHAPNTGQWQAVQYSFTVHEGTNSMGFFLRSWGDGTTYWDKTSLVLSETENVEHIRNGGFERVSENTAKVWSVVPDAVTSAPDTTEVFVGDYSMRQNSSTGYIAQSLHNIVSGETYCFSAYVFPKETTTRPAIKAELNTEYGFLDAVSHEFDGLKVGQWQKIEYTFRVPDGVTSVGFMLRSYGNGGTYWDVVSIIGPAKDKVTQKTTAETFLVETAHSKYRMLYGNAEGALVNGQLQLMVPSQTLAILMPLEAATQGVEKNGIVYSFPKQGGIVRCPDDAIAAQYIRIEGKLQLIALYQNGETVKSDGGELKIFRWDKMQPR